MRDAFASSVVAIDDLRLIFPNANGRWLDYGYIDPSKVPLLGANSDSVTAIWGDSHGGNLLNGLVAESKADGLSYKFFISYGTLPLIGVGSGNTGMVPRNEDVLAYILKHPEIKNVILTANWTGYLFGNRWFGHRGGLDQRFQFQGVRVTQAEAYPVFKAQLQKTIQAITSAGRRVFLCTPIPTYPYNVPDAIDQLHRQGRDVNRELSYSLDDYTALNRQILDIFRDASLTFPNTYVIPIHLDLFRECRSLLEENGQSLYNDGQHLSEAGSYHLGHQVAEAIKQASP